MANFPTWTNKNKSTAMNNSSNLSPRQVANKAYTLAIKKLDRDDKRSKPQYTVRERLLLSNTMVKAENVLNKRTPRFNRRVLASEADDDILPPPKKLAMASPVKPNQVLEQHAPVHVTPTPAAPLQIKNESLTVTTTITSIEQQQQMAVVSIAVAAAAAAAYSSLSVSEKQSILIPRDSICRPVMIPSHTNMTSITTII